MAVDAAFNLAHGITSSGFCCRDHRDRCHSPDNSYYVSSVLTRAVEAHLERGSGLT